MRPRAGCLCAAVDIGEGLSASLAEPELHCVRAQAGVKLTAQFYLERFHADRGTGRR
jgi:hypothetical protein